MDGSGDRQRNRQRRHGQLPCDVAQLAVLGLLAGQFGSVDPHAIMAQQARALESQGAAT